MTQHISEQQEHAPSPPGNDELSSAFRNKVIFIVGLLSVVGVVLFMLISASGILPLVFIAVLIAILLRSLANPLSEFTNIPSRWMVILVAVSLFVFISAFVALTGPQITQQFDQLTMRIPEALTSVEEELRQYEWGASILDSLEHTGSGGGNNVFSRLTGFFSSAFGALTNMFLVVVAGIYLAFEPNLYIDGLLRLLPINRRDHAFEIMDEGFDIMRRWLIARLLSMVVVGILTFIGLWLIDMPLALTLAIMAGLLSFIPNLGPILSAFPAILVGLTQGITLGVLAAIVYFTVQQIENYLITPNIQRETVKLPPALVMLSQVFLLLLFGWLGLFIAAPLVALCIVIVKSLYVEDFLNDEVGRIVGD